MFVDKSSPWRDNQIQFPRLIAEIEADELGPEDGE